MYRYNTFSNCARSQNVRTSIKLTQNISCQTVPLRKHAFKGFTQSNINIQCSAMINFLSDCLNAGKFSLSEG